MLIKVLSCVPVILLHVIIIVRIVLVTLEVWMMPFTSAGRRFNIRLLFFAHILTLPSISIVFLLIVAIPDVFVLCIIIVIDKVIALNLKSLIASFRVLVSLGVRTISDNTELGS